MSMTPSLLWQQLLLVIGCGWLLFEIRHGWKLGLIRGVMKLLALFAAWFVGTSAMAMSASFLFLFASTPSSLLSVGVAVAAGVIVYYLILLLAALFFKKTEHHQGLIRWILGLGGAVCGLFIGLFFLFGAISLIRSAGVLGEMRLLEAQQQGRSPSSDHVGCFLVKLKKSLEMGSMGAWLTQWDPLSGHFYETTQESMRLLQDPEALRRFVEEPRTQKMLNLPSVRRVLQDPAFQEALHSGNMASLFQNKNIQALFRDSQFYNELKSFNFSEALQESVRKQRREKALH